MRQMPLAVAQVRPWASSSSPSAKAMLRLARLSRGGGRKWSPGGIDVADVEVDGRLAQPLRVDAAHLGPCEQRRGDRAAQRAVEHVGDDAAIEHGVGAAAAALRRHHPGHAHHGFAGIARA